MRKRKTRLRLRFLGQRVVAVPGESGVYVGVVEKISLIGSPVKIPLSRSLSRRPPVDQHD